MENKQVVVGLSGGVDSAVTAFLLREQGWDVYAVMLKLWAEPGFHAENRCSPTESIQLAEQIASQLAIPFRLLDASEYFYEQVVQPFSTAYLNGTTPNPCVMCNQYVRWYMMLLYANSIGIDTIATGHYALLRNESGVTSLYRGMDPQKDQSYVLSRLTQEQLSHTLLPLAQMKKEDVRRIAKEAKLPSATRRDSQDICFIGTGGYRDFLERNYPGQIQAGKIIDRAGNVLGSHPGVAFFTPGQRKGLKIAAAAPYYVLEKRPETQELVVGFAEEAEIRNVTAVSFNWINGKPETQSFDCHAQFRYKMKDQLVHVRCAEDDTIEIQLATPRNDIAAGQIAVLYTEDGRVLGGGIITKTTTEIKQ